MPSKLLLAAVAALLPLGACTAVLGYGDIEVRDDAAAGAGTSGGGTTASGGPTASGGTGPGGGSAAAGAVGGGGAPPSCGEGWSCQPTADEGSLVLVPSSEFCPTGWSVLSRLYDDPNPGCPSCTCAPSSGECSHADVERYWHGGCVTNKDTRDGVADGTCVDVYEAVSSNQAQSYRVTVVPENESCAPDDDTPEPVVRLPTCEPTATPPGSCASGTECMPAVPDSQGRFCVLLVGAAACPAAYPDRSTVYGSADDSRSCQCSCGAVVGSGCSNAGVALHQSEYCSASPLEFLPAGSCQDSGSPTHDGYAVDTGTYQGGNCQPMFTSSGSVSFTEPYTLCCPG